jgi:hypothetical protein
MIVFKSKYKRKIDENILKLFGYSIISSIGKYNNNKLILSKYLIDNNNSKLILHYENNILKYWSVNNKKHTQLYINDFLKLCNEKYYLNFKIKH